MIIETAQRTKQTSEYYFSVKLAEVRKLIAEGHDVINLGIGNPDMMPSEETLKLYQKLLRNRRPTAISLMLERLLFAMQSRISIIILTE
jgi:aspartate/methionine/tyrosine aminotransferase